MPPGATLDVFGYEYRGPSGRRQTTYITQYATPPGGHAGEHRRIEVRNGLRLVGTGRRETLLSRRTRCMRHVSVRARNLAAPATLHKIAIRDGLLPHLATPEFACSDPWLTELFDRSRRTAELSMTPDSFIDAMIEQTLRVGDARLEALYGLHGFRAVELSARCLRIAARSLDRLPMVQAQVPTPWEVMIPAWSFLWGLWVWDHYHFTGDRALLAELWPDVLKNLRSIRMEPHRRTTRC